MSLVNLLVVNMTILDSEKENLKRALVKFYEAHNPEMVGKVEDVASYHERNVVGLNLKLREKYHADLSNIGVSLEGQVRISNPICGSYCQSTRFTTELFFLLLLGQH